MSEPLEILLIDDSPTDAKLISRELAKSPRAMEIERVDDAPGLSAALDRRARDLIICDWSMPRFSPIAALKLLKERGLDLPFIIVSGTIGEENAVEAMRAGAHDYVLKDRLGRLLPAIERLLREYEETAARRRAERALRESQRALLESEARFRRLWESGIILIGTAAKDGKILDVNDAGARMLGYTRDEMLTNMHWMDLASAESRSADLNAGAELELRGVAQPWERGLIRKDGGRIWVMSAVASLDDENGTRIAIAVDITNQKRSEQALLERVRIATSIAQINVALSSDRTLEETLRHCADAMVTELGAAGVRLSTYNPSSRALELRAESGAIRPDTVVTTHSLHVDGTVVGLMEVGTVEPVGAIFSTGLGAIANGLAVGIQRKLVERAKVDVEAQLRHAQKMEAVGRLAGGVAHDFNNLLSVILSYSELMLSELRAEDPMRQDLEEVVLAGKRAAELTRQLLLFSRQQVLEPKTLDLNEELTSLEKMLKRLVGEDIELATRTSGTPAKIRADRSSIEQVIMNLVVNARDAMPTGGRLVLETSTVMLDDTYVAAHYGSRAGPHVSLRVIDSGSGMDKTTQARIFDPFFTTKEQGKGTGLGLSTVFGIVQQAGGHIVVNSEPGRGTTFEIFLPETEAPTDRPGLLASSASVRGWETILLVEDEDQVRAIAGGILRRHGYQVIEARNAGEALLACESMTAPIHLLLTDVVMPLVSGPELARRLVSAYPELKVLCMSGYTDDAAVRHGVIADEIEYLQKPFTVDSLTRKVRAVLDRIR